MKKLILSLSFVVSSFNFVAQNNEIIKEFINKNEILIRNVHKHLYHQNNSAKDKFLQSLLKAQLEAITTMNVDATSAVQYAFMVRKEGLAFMRKNTKSSVEYFLITKEEEQELNLSLPAKVEYKHVEETTLQKADKVTASNANALNEFIMSAH